MLLAILGTINAVCKAISDICLLLSTPEGQQQLEMWRQNNDTFRATVQSIVDHLRATAEWTVKLNTGSDRPAVIEAIFGGKTK